MTDELVAFLRARLDEDERVAREEAERRAEWDRQLTAMHAAGNVPSIAFLEYDAPGAPGDPTRVLAEVEAKQQILDTIVPSLEAAIEKIENEWVTDWGHPGRAEDLLRLLALPYTAHPDYRDEWKP